MAQLPEAAGLTARQIVQNFKNLYAAGRQTDDSRISDRQWLFNLDHHRAQLLRQQAEKGQSPNENNLQALEVRVPKQGCGTWYAAHGIPAAVECYQSNLYTFVGSASGVAYQKTTAQRAQWDALAKYTAALPKWYQIGDVLNLRTPPSPTLNIVSVRGVFENPRAVLAYNGYVFDDVDYLEFPYPVSRTALDTLSKLLTDNELKLAWAHPEDHLNDGRDA